MHTFPCYLFFFFEQFIILSVPADYMKLCMLYFTQKHLEAQ